MFLVISQILLHFLLVLLASFMSTTLFAEYFNMYLFFCCIFTWSIYFFDLNSRMLCLAYNSFLPYFYFGLGCFPLV